MPSPGHPDRGANRRVRLRDRRLRVQHGMRCRRRPRPVVGPPMDRGLPARLVERCVRAMRLRRGLLSPSRCVRARDRGRRVLRGGGADRPARLRVPSVQGRRSDRRGFRIVPRADRAGPRGSGTLRRRHRAPGRVWKDRVRRPGRHVPAGNAKGRIRLRAPAALSARHTRRRRWLQARRDRSRGRRAGRRGNVGGARHRRRRIPGHRGPLPAPRPATGCLRARARRADPEHPHRAFRPRPGRDEGARRRGRL